MENNNNENKDSEININDILKKTPSDSVVNDSVVTNEETKDVATTTVSQNSTVEIVENDTTNVTENTTELEDNSDVFITEKDTFDIRISYYKKDGEIYVESVDDEFDDKNFMVKHIDVTFKYPSQGDYESIIAQNSYKTPDKMTLIDVMQMELTRLVVLIRKWSLKAEFNRMLELDTKIVKAMTNKVREKIGVKGIL